MPYRLAGSDTYPCHTGRPMQLAQIICQCHTGWPDLIPIRAIPVGQCSLPKSVLRAIQVGRIRCLSVPYRSANAVRPNHSSVPYRLAQIIQVGWIRYPSVPDRSASAVSPNHLSMPYRLAGSDTYPCHTGWPMQLNNSSVPYRSANAVGPNHLSVPYRLAGFDTYLCHTGRPMQFAQIISPCHTGWPIPICVIQVGQCSLPKSFVRAIQVGQCSLPKSFVRAIQVGQCSQPKSFLCVIQVGRIRYPSVPYRLTGSDTYPCHTGRLMHLNNSSVPYRSANAVGPNHLSVPFRLAGFDTYPCHTGWPMQLAQISSPCHTGWPDLIPIRAILVGQCSWPKSVLRAIQVGRIS